MKRKEYNLTQLTAYLFAASVAIVSAAGLYLLGTVQFLPVIGALSLPPVTAVAAIAGLLLLGFLQKRGTVPSHPLSITPTSVVSILVLGGLLALPPIGIDIVLGFPEHLNLAMPDALFFYPGIALVAEVAFHLLPLALLSVPFTQSKPPGWLIWPVVLVEPFFQVFFLSGSILMGVLVLGNVSLISAAQLWLFRRYGFLAMIGLRWSFYLFWHIVWGQARLALIF